MWSDAVFWLGIHEVNHHLAPNVLLIVPVHYICSSVLMHPDEFKKKKKSFLLFWSFSFVPCLWAEYNPEFLGVDEC